MEENKGIRGKTVDELFEIAKKKGYDGTNSIDDIKAFFLDTLNLHLIRIDDTYLIEPLD